VFFIREFQVGDEEGLWEVFYSSIHQVCSNDYSQEQIQAWASTEIKKEFWSTKMQSIKPFVAVSQDKIIGYADLQDNGLIDHFFVHGDYQSKGVATSLMNTILKKGKGRKRLYSEVSHTAKPFYEKHGFHVVREQEVLMRGVALTNNIMERCG
jgi:putative acetyltransferase